MNSLNSVDKILDFAILQEEKAVQLYTDLAGRVERPWMRQVFEEFAEEERVHKRKLLEVKSGKRLQHAIEKVQDLKIADYTVDADPGQELDYQQALIIAMKKEKAAFRMYSDLAGATDDENLRGTFLMLAQEEARHKLRFEIEYDDYILRDN